MDGAGGGARQRKGRDVPAELEEAEVVLETAKTRPSAEPKLLGFQRTDALIFFAFLALALFARLVNIADPRAIVFDETHFTKFSTWYVSGHYYVDIHPPLAKLVYAAVIHWMGFVGAQERNVKWWTHDGFVGTKDWELLYSEEYRSPVTGTLPYLPLRITAALIGSLLVPVAFASSRALGLGRVPSAIAAWLVICDTVSSLQSRLILCDAFLYLFNVASFGASFASVNPALNAREQAWWAVFTGLMLGCAMSVKLTAIGTVGTVGIHQALVLYLGMRAAGAADKKTGALTSGGSMRVLHNGIWRGVLMLGTASVFFFTLWIIHINILPYSGQGDSFASPAYSSTLIEKPPIGQTVSVYDTSAALDPNACPNSHNTWSDCGFSPMTEDQCIALGCCWDPTSNKAWCYHTGVLKRPSLNIVWKIADVLRATNALNHGGAVMIHPFMSEWREWPLLGGKSVPFGSSNAGGAITCLGNPGVHWPVFGFVVASIVAGALLVAGRLWRAVTAPIQRTATSVLYEQSTWGNEVRAWPSDRQPDSDARATPLWVALVTLTCGYLANLVPYELITRSKFLYHYTPALLIGILLAATCVDAAWAWAYALGAKRAAEHPNRRLAVAIGTALLALAAGAGFYYWGLPSVYGLKLTHEQAQARKWREGW